MKVVMCVLAVLNVGLWSGLVALSVPLMRNVVERNLPGYSSTGQLIYYLGIPLMMAATALLISTWRLYARKEGLAVFVLSITLGFLPFYMLAYTSGM